MRALTAVLIFWSSL